MTSSVAAHEDAVVDEEVSGGHDGPEALRKAKEEVVGLWKTEVSYSMPSFSCCDD